MKGIKFVSGEPALYINGARTLAIGDLHLGMEVKLAEHGLHFANVSAKMAESIRRICEKTGAKHLALLGDIKDSIGYPTAQELDSIKEFFEGLKGIEITAIKGNHDAHLEDIFKRIGERLEIRKEIRIGNVTLLHGNALPSSAALEGRHIVTAHGHIAVKDVDGIKKAWLVAVAGQKAESFCKTYNHGIELVVMPAFSPLITGSEVNAGTKSHMPLLSRGIFDFDSAGVYSLGGKFIARAGELA